MQVDSMISELEKNFPGWKIGNKIGDGSGGKTSVYRFARENFEFTENDVIKIVSLLEENVGLDEMNEISRRNYEAKREELRRKAEEEVMLMYKLKTCRNIVGYQDFKVVELLEKNHISLLLAIRMFTYRDLNSIVQTKGLSQYDIIKIGIDICSALEECTKHGIIHRDIKPGNIFYDDNQYLLADFGISRIIEEGNLAHTSQGTPQFAAPEQFANLIDSDGYDHRVDIYSLGLTLYFLANNQKLPFQDQFPGGDLAVQMRLAGKEIPPIDGVNPELNRIMLKACAYHAYDRYSDAGEMKADLASLYRKTKNQKGIKQVGKSAANSVYETECVMPEIKNYGTERALNLTIMDNFGTESALSKSISEGFATERALQTPGTEGFATEKALQTPGSEGFATERALQTQKSTDSGIYNSVSRDNELGVAVASVDTVDTVDEPLNSTDSDNSAHTVEFDRPSEQDIRKNAISEMQKGNNEQAFEYYATLAEKEGWEVMYDDVTKSFDGEQSIIRRSDDAVYWFTKCVECCKDSWTVSLAEFQLGDIYAKGIGVKKSHKIAEKYYRSSASKGNPYAKKKFVAGKYVK